MNKVTIAFDIETYKDPIESVDYMSQRPVGISVIGAVLAFEGHPDAYPFVWWGTHPVSWAVHPRVEPKIPDALIPLGVTSFLSWLGGWMSYDATVVGWNSAGFDFQILLEETQNLELSMLVSSLCKLHIDIMYHFACCMGYRLGLDAAAKGMGLAGKQELEGGAHGEAAPGMWKKGVEERRKVIKYLVRDCVTTLETYQAIVANHGLLNWTSKKGRPMSARLGEILTVAEASKLPMPDMSWGTPFDRNYSVGWMADTIKE